MCVCKLAYMKVLEKERERESECIKMYVRFDVLANEKVCISMCQKE